MVDKILHIQKKKDCFAKLARRSFSVMIGEKEKGEVWI